MNKYKFNSDIEMEIDSSDSPTLSEIKSDLNEIKEKINFIEKKKYINESLNNIIHYGIKCSNCNQLNFKGIRYKCLTCPNYNVCQDCENLLITQHCPDHFFLRIHNSYLYDSIKKNNII